MEKDPVQAIKDEALREYQSLLRRIDLAFKEGFLDGNQYEDMLRKATDQYFVKVEASREDNDAEENLDRINAELEELTEGLPCADQDLEWLIEKK